MAEIIKNLVSTIIPVYNRPHMLREAVESVLAQTYRPIEIIISDDGSTDETLQVAEQFKLSYPDIIHIVSNSNQGAGPAREAGRKIAQGEFIQYLDSDDRLLPDKFKVQVKALRENIDYGVAYGITRLVSLNNEIIEQPYKRTGKDIETLFPGLLVDRWWCTHTPLYRKTVCDAVGQWSDLKYSRDWEYDGRVGALGTKLVWCDALVSEHRTHSDNRQTGHGRWLEPEDRVRFFTSLLNNAKKTGVLIGSDEMRFFSKWMFFNARYCAYRGDSTAARNCLDIGISALAKEPFEFMIFRIISEKVGWKVTGYLSYMIDRIRSGREKGAMYD